MAFIDSLNTASFLLSAHLNPCNYGTSNLIPTL